MNVTATADKLSIARLRVRPIRIAELSLVAFFAFVTGLPLLFLLGGSFNLAAPGQAALYGVANWARAFNDPTTMRATGIAG